MSVPFRIQLTKVRCLVETSEFDSDEPYVLVFAADLTKTVAGVKVPSAVTTKYGPWDDVDSKELLVTIPWIPPAFPPGSPDIGNLVWRRSCWGLNGNPASVQSPADFLILVAVMENDSGNPEGVRTGLHAQLFAALSSYVNSNMDRTSMVQQLKQDMNDALDGAIGAGFDWDDRVGSANELKLTTKDIAKIGQGQVVAKGLLFSGDGGQYRLRFEMGKNLL